MSSVTLNAGQSVAVTPVPLETDGTVTQGASLSGVTLSTSDLTVASIVENADGTITLKGIAAGTASLSGVAQVTDPNGAVSTISGSASITVLAVAPPPPTPLSTSLGFEFGTPA